MADREPGPFEVLLTEDAEQDLAEIHEWIAERDGPMRAERVLDGMLQVVESLERLPERGSRPQELAALGIRTFRQTHFKPWRIICQVVGRQVHVMLIADGRRDMQAVLARRLLRW